MRFFIIALAALSVFSCRTVSGDQIELRSADASPLYDAPLASNVENTGIITGMVQIYGNEPHTYVGIVEGNGTEYAVYPRSSEDELRRLQGHLIEFTVIFLDEPKDEGGLYLKGGTVTPLSWEILR